MTRLALPTLIALATTASGCRPGLIWSGRTADRRHRIDIVDEGGVQWVMRDGRRRAGHREIAAWSLAMSQDGQHLAYAARLNGRWTVFLDGRPRGTWDGVGDLLLSPGGRLAYAAERGGRWRVVVDGVAGPPFGAVFAGTIALAGARRHAYAVRDAGGVRVVVDGAAGPAWSGVGALGFSADGEHVAYAARQGRVARAVVDGRLGPSFRAIRSLTLGGRGGGFAYAALDRAGWWVVGATGAAGPYQAIEALRFSPDGRHLAWLARTGGDTLVVCDGEVVGQAAARRADGLAFVATGGAAHPLVWIARDPDGRERVVGPGPSGPAYDAVGAIAVSGDGRRVGYPARRGDIWSVVVDGVEELGGRWVSSPIFSADGARFAYLARRGRGIDVVVDRRAHRFDFALDGTLVFSRDGRRWAVLAGDLDREQLFFSVDGTRRIPLSAREVYSASARLLARAPREDAGELLRAWAQAEADR